MISEESKNIEDIDDTDSEEYLHRNSPSNPKKESHVYITTNSGSFEILLS